MRTAAGGQSSSENDSAAVSSRLGMQAARRWARPTAGGRLRPAPLGSLAAATVRFVSGVSRPPQIRRQLAGPGVIRPSSVPGVVAMPRWWRPAESAATEDISAGRHAVAESARPVGPVTLPDRGLRRITAPLPSDAKSPGRFSAGLVGSAVPVRRMPEVRAAGSMNGAGAKLAPPPRRPTTSPPVTGRQTGGGGVPGYSPGVEAAQSGTGPRAGVPGRAVGSQGAVAGPVATATRSAADPARTSAVSPSVSRTTKGAVRPTAGPMAAARSALRRAWAGAAAALSKPAAAERPIGAARPYTAPPAVGSPNMVPANISQTRSAQPGTARADFASADVVRTEAGRAEIVHPGGSSSAALSAGESTPSQQVTARDGRESAGRAAGPDAGSARPETASPTALARETAEPVIHRSTASDPGVHSVPEAVVQQHGQAVMPAGRLTAAPSVGGSGASVTGEDSDGAPATLASLPGSRQSTGIVGALAPNDLSSDTRASNRTAWPRARRGPGEMLGIRRYAGGRLPRAIGMLPGPDDPVSAFAVPQPIRPAGAGSRQVRPGAVLRGQREGVAAAVVRRSMSAGTIQAGSTADLARQSGQPGPSLPPGAPGSVARHAAPAAPTSGPGSTTLGPSALLSGPTASPAPRGTAENGRPASDDRAATGDASQPGVATVSSTSATSAPVQAGPGATASTHPGSPTDSRSAQSPESESTSVSTPGIASSTASMPPQAEMVSPAASAGPVQLDSVRRQSDPDVGEDRRPADDEADRWTPRLRRSFSGPVLLRSMQGSRSRLGVGFAEYEQIAPAGSARLGVVGPARGAVRRSVRQVEQVAGSTSSHAGRLPQPSGQASPPAVGSPAARTADSGARPAEGAFAATASAPGPSGIGAGHGLSAGQRPGDSGRPGAPTGPSKVRRYVSAQGLRRSTGISGGVAEHQAGPGLVAAAVVPGGGFAIAGASTGGLARGSNVPGGHVVIRRSTGHGSGLVAAGATTIPVRRRPAAVQPPTGWGRQAAGQGGPPVPAGAPATGRLLRSTGGGSTETPVPATGAVRPAAAGSSAAGSNPAGSWWSGPTGSGAVGADRVGMGPSGFWAADSGPSGTSAIRRRTDIAAATAGLLSRPSVFPPRGMPSRSTAPGSPATEGPGQGIVLRRSPAAPPAPASAVGPDTVIRRSLVDTVPAGLFDRLRTSTGTGPAMGQLATTAGASAAGVDTQHGGGQMEIRRQISDVQRTNGSDIGSALTPVEWDQLVDLVVRRIEDRVSDELSRRGRFPGGEVF